MKIRSRTLLLAALSATGCTTEASVDEVSATTQAVTDPYSVHTPMYTISMTVFTDNAANNSTPVAKDWFSTTFDQRDQVRASLQAYQLSQSTLQLVPVDGALTCIIGDYTDRGSSLDPEVVYLTQSGRSYSTCAIGTAGGQEFTGRPLAFARPIGLGPDDKLYLYASLEVLNSGDVVALGSDPNAGGVPGALTTLGGIFSTVGTVVSVIPGANEIGAAGQAIGAVLTAAGQLAAGPQRAGGVGCTVTNSLVPAFGSNQAPTDTPSPALRVPLAGRDLWEKTASGDAILEFPLDWGDLPGTHLCHRPKSRVVFRVRRVVAENVPGDPTFARAQIINASYPDEYDAFSVDANRTVIHDQWKGNAWAPSLETLASKMWTSACGWMGCYGGYYPVFPVHAHIAALAKAPGNQDIYGISANGKLVNNWRNSGWDNNAWHDWVDHSSAYFPPGAPVAAISRNPGHIDIFAIATDGSLMTASWDSSAGWSRDATRISAAGLFKPWNGTDGGGVAAVSTGIDPYAAETVFAMGIGAELVQVSWTLFGGWHVYDNAGLPASAIKYVPGGGIAALQRSPNRTDLMFVDGNSRARALWYDRGHWYTQQIAPDSMSLMPGGEVAAVARKVDVTLDPLVDNDHMDFFTVGADGAIVHASWVAGENSGYWATNYAEKIPGIVADAGGPIGAVSPNPGSIQVTARKANGSTTHAWFKELEGTGLHWQQTP